MKYLLGLIILLITSTLSYCQEYDVKPYKILEGHKHKVQNAFFSPDGKYLIAGRPESDILVWKLSDLFKNE